MNTEQDIRQRILSLMRDRLMESGFSKVTLDEIADELGISKKTLYKYFSGKDELAMQAIRFQFLEVEAGFQAVEDAPLSFTEKLHAIIMIMRDRVSRITSFALQDIRKHAPQLWNEIDRLRHEHIFSKLESMIRHAREEGVLRPEVDERMLVKILFASAEAIANPVVQAELSTPMQDIIHSMFRIIFGGALTDEARAASRLFEKAEAPRTGAEKPAQ